MSSELVWLITGTSRHFFCESMGRELTLAALKRGDKVIATGPARSLPKLDDLASQGADILCLDVTDSLEQLQEAAIKAIAIHGRSDVLVNNAGYILVGAIEESTPQETYEQLQTNVFGAVNVTRAFLPYMRQKKSGTVVFVGSLGGWKSVPNLGIYASTKFALRGISETLHEEISPLGLRSTCIDLGYFRTSLLGDGQRVPYKPRIDDYKPITEKAEASLQAANGKQLGSPEKGVNVIIDVVKNEGIAKGKAFPTSLALGSDCYEVVKTASENNLKRLEEWKNVSFSTDF